MLLYQVLINQAVIQQFGHSPELSIFPQSSIGDCFKTLNAGNVDFAVVPFENSTNGQVVFTYDLLRDWFIGDNEKPRPTFQVVGEQFVAIHHYLLSNATEKSQIHTIYSHPQVWGQVSKLLKSYAKCTKVDVSSTAEAARIVSQDSTNTVACISSKMCAQLTNLPIIEAEIEDIPDNTTRFLVLGNKPAFPQRKQGKAETKEMIPLTAITSIMFTLNHDDPGALMAALDSFKQQNINLTSIASRPSRKSKWQYVFFVEAEGSNDSLRMREAEEGLHRCCSDVVILGSFARSQLYRSGQVKH